MPSSTPRLSIIIATWNAAKTLERCLASITAQTFTEWELLIQDGDSTDATLSILEKNKSVVTWYESAPDNGIYDAWNRALAHAAGEYVCFLGADDALHSPDVLGNLFATIGSDRYDLVSSRGQLRNADWGARGVIGSSWDDAGLPRRMNICHPGLMHHRSLFENFGVFDTSYRIAADLDFLLRLPATIKTMQVPLVTVDVQDDGVSRRQFWRRIRERRLVHARCPRVGLMKAWVFWADKVWRRPIALALRLPH